jgi:8-oxo-dGTP pyrophosphatase MutT (NUDIX family)
VGRPKSAKRETSAGGVIYRCTPDGPKFLLIKDGYKNWGFPKGHLKQEEGPAEAAYREVMEETSLTDLTLHEPLGIIDWFFRFRGRLIHKHCHFFLFESPTGSATPQAEEGIEQAFDYVDAPIQRVAQKEVPLPYNRNLEQMALPQVEDVIQAVKEVL